VKLLTNPLLLRAVVVLFSAGFAFFLVLILMRRLRKNIDEESTLSSDAAPSLNTLPLHLYNTVIQQLKQQKHELQVQTQTEQRRARTSENFSQAVLSHLSSGVLVFGANGLVKQANPAAKDILGFAAPTGMSAEDIFRDSSGSGAATAALIPLAGEVRSVLRKTSSSVQLEADYATPGGQKRHIAVTISPVPAVDGTLLGAACLINDLSEFERIRRQQELQGEISAEMALTLRSSLATISGYAQQLANNRDPELAQQLAADIANEAAHLDHSIGGYLTEKHALNRTAAHAGSGNQ
jgi:PAS domain-containing protein